MAQAVVITRARLAQTFLAALLASIFWPIVILGAIYGLSNFPTEAKRVLEIQPPFSGTFEYSPNEPKVDVWMTQDVFDRFTAGENQSIAVFISQVSQGNNELGYQLEHKEISFGYIESRYTGFYLPSGTIEIHGGSLIIPMQRSTVGLVVVSAIWVFFSGFLLMVSAMAWYFWYKTYRQQRVPHPNQPA